MSTEKDYILEFSQYMNSDKTLYVINADIESLIKKIDGCANNPENSSATKTGENIPCGYPMSIILGFDRIEDKQTLYCGKDCMKKFFNSLREHAKNVIDFEKKNGSTNKRRIKIVSRYKSILYLWKKNTLVY